tara:strand:+ start:5246 stop:6046 length:801 start_codon:yes stop_codon:yes gene_type:complete
MDIGGFIETLDMLNKTTIKNHSKNIVRLDDLIDVNDEPRTNIKILRKQEKRIPTLMSLYKTLMKYINYIGYDDLLQEYLTEYNKIKIGYDSKKKKDTKNMLLNSIYNQDDLYKKLAEFYKDKNYTAYVITHLLLNYNIRNLDLDLLIIQKGDKMEDNLNYIMIFKSMVKIYINVYKTSNTYDKKLFIIKDYRFNKSVGSIYKIRDKLLINNKNLTNEIIKYTPYNLNEVSILKILLNDNDTIDYYKKVSESRGTDYQTLIKSYSNL